jgi:hypothetical protein
MLGIMQGISLHNNVVIVNPIPANALLAEDGIPILDENGNYILLEI